LGTTDADHLDSHLLGSWIEELEEDYVLFATRRASRGGSARGWCVIEERGEGAGGSGAERDATGE
jgi:hypothetical protein